METAIIGERGQVTIPKRLREQFGIEPKSSVVFEETNDGIIIRPAVTVSLRSFTSEFVDEITAEDVIGKDERADILAHWKKHA